MNRGKFIKNLTIVLTFIFLYAPIIVLVIYSFNSSSMNIIFENFTFDWYSGDNSSTQNQQKHDLIEQRYKLDQIMSILSDKNTDINDILDELLRNNTQSSLPDEKIVLLKKNG